MGIAHNDPLSLDCVVEGGCVANLRIPDGTPEATVEYLRSNSSFNKDVPFLVYGPVEWNVNAGAFCCSGLSLTDACTKEANAKAQVTNAKEPSRPCATGSLPMVMCAEGCQCIMCSVGKVCKHPAYKQKIQVLIEEFNEKTKDNPEWVNWQRTYPSWHAGNLDTCGVIDIGPECVWAIKGHPVLELMTCGVSIEVKDVVWHKIEGELFKCCCQALRLRYDFLMMPKPLSCI
jgi:hypothetical protein